MNKVKNKYIPKNNIEKLYFEFNRIKRPKKNNGNAVIIVIMSVIFADLSVERCLDKTRYTICPPSKDVAGSKLNIPINKFMYAKSFKKDINAQKANILNKGPDKVIKISLEKLVLYLEFSIIFISNAFISIPLGLSPKNIIADKCPVS